MSLRAALRLLAVSFAAAFLSASACQRKADQPGTTEGALAGKTGAPDAGTLLAGPCLHDEDCALTRLIPGRCCSGCGETAVLRAPLKQRELDCADASQRCPAMSCAPPRFMTVAVCRQGQCATERVSNE